ncbi:MAG: AbrB/MazE/SpoVT family DNA-binding domain-containing protein [Clostridia bacterium]|nr:AbrB/MazE/SpoVT family DNA-binding domain-containing protein [Clostridia bacterium]
MKEKFLWAVKVSDKGQICLPKEAREVFNINTGDSLILFGDVKRGIAIAKYSDYVEFAESIFNGTLGEKND